MKASRLVEELQRAIEEHGDIEVLVYNLGNEEREPRLTLLEAKWRQSYHDPLVALVLN